MALLFLVAIIHYISAAASTTQHVIASTRGLQTHKQLQDKVVEIFSGLESANTLRGNGLGSLQAIVTMSDPEEDADSGNFFTHSVKIKGYSVQTFENKHRSVFCSFVTIELGMSATQCKVLTVKPVSTGTPNDRARRRSLTEDAILVEYAVYYEPQMTTTDVMQPSRAQRNFFIVILTSSVAGGVILVVALVAIVAMLVRKKQREVAPHDENPRMQLTAHIDSENDFLVI